MQRTKVICDRCGKEVKYPIKRHFRLYRYLLISVTDDDRVDLCERCEQQLIDWFMKGDARIDMH